MVWAALSFVTEIPADRRGGRDGPTPKPTPCVVQVARVSGTIRKSEEELVRRARREIVRAKILGGDGEERALERLLGGKGKGRDVEMEMGGVDFLDEGGIEDEDMGDDSD